MEKVEQYVYINGRAIPTGQFAIVRKDTAQVLGSVGGRYRIFTNEESFDFLDGVVGDGGAQYETAGALGKGEKVWLLARMPKAMQIAGDEVLNYLMFSTTHDGTGTIKVFPTNVRTVCQNTYRMALATRSGGISIRHTNNVKNKVKVAQKALGLANEAADDFQEKAFHLAGTQIEAQEYFSTVLDHVMDVTIADQKVTGKGLDDGSILKTILEIQDIEARESAEKKINRVINRREKLLEDILERHETERNNGNPKIAGTAWAAYNAISEHIDHSELNIYRGGEQERMESRFESVLTGRGDEVKQTAFQMALGQTV